MPKLDQTELQAIVSAEIDDARAYIDEIITPLRAVARRYYKGEPFGNEEEGRSQVVSRDVADTVNSLLPSLMKIFTSSEKVVEFAPTGPEDEQLAAQATDYCNYVYSKDNNGYLNLYHTFKDAMTGGTGIQKIWWDETEEVSIQEYEGLDEATIAILMQEPDTEVNDIEVETRIEQQQDPMTGQMMSVEVPYYECTVKRTTKEGRIKVEVLPPEEFLISRRARSLQDASIVAHRALLTVSELVAMGYDRDEVEEMVSSTDEFLNNEESTDRYALTSGMGNDTQTNPSMRKVMYVEAYIRVDEDGDGIAELRKFCCIGDDYKIMEDEPCEIIPFAEFTVDSEPHVSCVEATSTADKVMDLQLLKSAIWRNSLDSMAQTLNPRIVFLDGQVNVDDLKNNEVGALIRERTQGAVRELTSQPIFQQAFGMMDYIDSVKENRTGISKAAAGLDPDVLKNTTMNAANFMVTATQSQMELVARNLSNGLKNAFKLMLKLMVTHQDKPRIIRLRNQWVPIDPRLWSAKMDVEVNVALGRGTDQERLVALNLIAQKQEMILQTLGPQNPLVTLPQYANTLTKIVELSGFKNTNSYITDLPDDFQMPPPAPVQDPNAQATQMLAQVEQQKAQMKMQIDQAKLQADQQVQEAKLALEREKMQADFARKQLELEMQSAKMQAELQMKEAEMVLKQLTMIRGGQENEANANEASQGQEASEAKQEGMLAQAITALGALIAQSQQATAQAMNTPKRVIRDQSGRVAGVEPIQGGQDDNQIL